MGGQEARIRVLGIVGSLGARSSNLMLLEMIASVAPEEIEVVLYAGLGDLPHFDPDLDPDAAPPAVRALRHAIAASDALLVAAPEYGHSLPGVLKNAIDWLIGSGSSSGRWLRSPRRCQPPSAGDRGSRPYVRRSVPCAP